MMRKKGISSANQLSKISSPYRGQNIGFNCPSGPKMTVLNGVYTPKHPVRKNHSRHFLLEEIAVAHRALLEAKGELKSGSPAQTRCKTVEEEEAERASFAAFVKFISSGEKKLPRIGTESKKVFLQTSEDFIS